MASGYQSGAEVSEESWRAPGLQSTSEVHDWVLISTMESSVSTKMADELYSEKEDRLVGVLNGKPPSPRPRKKKKTF